MPPLTPRTIFLPARLIMILSCWVHLRDGHFITIRKAS